MNKFAEPKKEDTYEYEILNKSGLPLGMIGQYTKVEKPNSDDILATMNSLTKRVKIVGIHPIFTRTYFIIQHLN